MTKGEDKMTPALEANDLSVDRSGTRVLRNISFAVQRGDVYALLGGNGAGKSTTLLAFLGFLPAATGSVRVEGREVRESLHATRQAIAYLPEAASLYGHLTAYENLGYLLSLADVKSDRPALDSALDRVALPPDARAQRMDTYSKGMRQKVAIALALMRDAPVLLLDEPTSGLDPVAIDEFNALIRTLSDEGRTVLMVTHDVYGACQAADQIGLLRKGKLVGNFQRSDDGAQIDTQAVRKAFAERAAP